MWKHATRRLWDKNRIKNVCAAVIVGVLFTEVYCSVAGVTSVRAIEKTDSEYFIESTVTANETIPEDALRVNDGCYYIPSENCFYTTISGIGYDAIKSNVCDGMFVQGDVEIEISNETTYEVYKDGVLLENYNGESLVEPGSYSVSVYNNSGRNEVPLSFTIIGNKTNSTSLAFTNNLRIESFTKDDIHMSYSDNRVNLEDGGNYKIEYQVAETGRTYKLEIEVDTQPPVLALEAVDENGKAKGPVDISDLEEDCEIYIMRDDNAISYREELTVPGKYNLLLIDEAGNQTVYSFTILIYFTTNSFLLLLSILLVIAGIVAYMIHARKNLRVR